MTLFGFETLAYLLGMRLVEKFWPGGEFWTGEKSHSCGASIYKTLIAQLAAITAITASVTWVSGFKMDQPTWNAYYLLAAILTYAWGYFHYVDIKGKRLDRANIRENIYHTEPVFTIKRDPEDIIDFLTVRASLPCLGERESGLHYVTAGAFVQVGPHFVSRENARQFAKNIIDEGYNLQELLDVLAFKPKELRALMPGRASHSK